MSDKEIDELIKELNEKDISISTFKYELENKNKELETYKRLAEANLKDSEEFEKNMCEHRCPIKSDYEEVKQELETYKKIAEFLAGGLKFWSNSKMSEEELIDWARKEVENGNQI